MTTAGEDRMMIPITAQRETITPDLQEVVDHLSAAVDAMHHRGTTGEGDEADMGDQEGTVGATTMSVR